VNLAFNQPQLLSAQPETFIIKSGGFNYSSLYLQIITSAMQIVASDPKNDGAASEL